MIIFRGLRFKPDTEIGPFGLFEMASKNTKAPKGIQCPLKAYNWHLPESYFHGVLQKVHPVKFRL